MAVKVKKIVLWRREVENKPGVLSQVLGPLAEAGVDLQIVMGYRYPGEEHKAAIEVAPISGKKKTAAAESAGLAASAIPTLLVHGDDQPGLGAAIGSALAEAGLNISFLVAQVVKSRFSAVIGLENDQAAEQAAALIKKAARKGAKATVK